MLGTQRRRGLGQAELNIGFKLIVRSVLCIFILIQHRLDNTANPLNALLSVWFSLCFFYNELQKTPGGFD